MVISLVTQDIACDSRLTSLELRLLIYLGGEDGLTPCGHDGYSRLLARPLARRLQVPIRDVIQARTRLVSRGYIERRLAEFLSGGRAIHHYCYRIVLH